jgi:hypothetical protein|tara:strand:- start:1994 stop:2275 length:282 start_codon:yes stop_codon:yes gene_type:complete
MHYPTEIGESIAVLGSIQELGAWKDYKHHLKWTEGHNWVSEKPIETKNSCFFYKYVLLQDLTEFKGWERGMDRIADLKILPGIGHNAQGIRNV